MFTEEEENILKLVIAEAKAKIRVKKARENAKKDVEPLVTEYETASKNLLNSLTDGIN